MQSCRNWLASNGSAAILRTHTWFSFSIRSSHLWIAVVLGLVANNLDMIFLYKMASKVNRVVKTACDLHP